MKIVNVRHKGLRRLIEADDRSGLPSPAADKIIDMLAFLQDMTTPEELARLAVWKPHQLKGDRRDTWALHVTKNWRLTFQVDRDNSEIIGLNYEDYH